MTLTPRLVLIHDSYTTSCLDTLLHHDMHQDTRRRVVKMYQDTHRLVLIHHHMYQDKDYS